MSESVVRQNYRVAVAQAAPAFLDLEKGVEKAIELIGQAAKNGAALIAFPELWLPGYPWWIWLDSPAGGFKYVRRYFENSMEVGDRHFKALQDAAARHKIFVSIGYSERAGGSLYISQALIDDAGELILARRKLKPTHAERYVFGEGDGSHLCVKDTSLGRMGSLCCAEHLQPLTKCAMYSQNEQIHIAAWPSFSVYRGLAYQLGPEANTAASQMYALEGQCYVLAACAVVSKEMIEELIDSPTKQPLLREGGGFSMIFGPDAAPLCEPLPEISEGIIYADIDLGQIGVAKASYDPVGHYSRPDVLRLMFNRKSASRVHHVDHTNMEIADFGV